MRKENEGVLSRLLLCLVQAQATAIDTEEGVYISHDRQGEWSEVYDDDMAETPEMMIEITPGGSIRLIDNRPNCTGLTMFEDDKL